MGATMPTAQEMRDLREWITRRVSVAVGLLAAVVIAGVFAYSFAKGIPIAFPQG